MWGKLMLHCKEVTESIYSDQLLKTGSWHRLGVRMHLLMCRKCRQYREQMRAIGGAARQMWRSQPEEASVLDRLEDQILKGVTPPSNNDAERKDPGGRDEM